MSLHPNFRIFTISTALRIAGVVIVLELARVRAHASLGIPEWCPNSPEVSFRNSSSHEEFKIRRGKTSVRCSITK